MISADNFNGDNHFKLISGNRLELLAKNLAAHLADGDIFAPETIVVQSRGMERWLALHLAESNGIAANLRFIFPKALITEHIFQAMTPGLSEHEVFPEPEIAAWKIRELLPELIPTGQDFAPLANYIADDQSGLKLFQLALQLANLFDNYLVFRPDVIREWDRRRNPLAEFPESRWQMKLWNRLREGTRATHFAAMRESFLSLIYPDLYPEWKPAAPCGFQLPPRIFFFGFTSLAPSFMDLIFAASRLTEIHFYYLTPCQEQGWECELGPKQALKLAGRELKTLVEKSELKTELLKQELERRLQTLHVDEGNSLLSSLGGQGREFFSLINAMNEADSEQLFAAAPADTLLHKIQRDIQTLRNPAGERNSSAALIAWNDYSIQFHSCHSPMREVEALFENLTDMFERDPSLLPKDVLVLATEIEKYAPYIEAVFNARQQDDPRWFFATIADRRRSCSSAETAAFIALLKLCAGRFKAPEALDILETPAVAARFKIEEAELPLIRQWICDANISWGIDHEFRKRATGAAFYENSWRAGLSSMLAGLAMGGEQNGATPIWNGAYSGNILPGSGFSEQNADLLGRFAEFMERLFKLFDRINSPAAAEQAFFAPWWRQLLLETINSFFADDDAFAAAVQELRATADAVAGHMAKAGTQSTVKLEVVIYALQTSLDSASLSGGFLRGGVTFCEARPLRSIPARVICMLGMDENSFPRRSAAAGFDLMTHRPRFGDRSARNDDRFLFLECLLSARDVFYLSYTGQGNKDNVDYPPSVTVSELLDYIAGGYRFTTAAGGVADSRDEIERRLKTVHPLQAFSWRYFAVPEPGADVVCPAPLLSYSSENLRAARRLQHPSQDRIFLEQELDAPPDELLKINLNDLIAFFRNPAKYFLTKRLRIQPAVRELPEIAECEKFELDSLDRYALAGEFLQHDFTAWLDRERRDELREQLKLRCLASGALPPGQWGEQQFEKLFIEISAFAEKIAPHVQKKQPSTAIELNFADGISIFAQLENIYLDAQDQPAQMLFRYASLKETDLIRAAILNLAGNLETARRNRGPLPTTVFGKDKFCVCAPPESAMAAENELRQLLDIFILGLRRPLPFFPATSTAYYRTVVKTDDAGKALAEARKKWNSGFGGAIPEAEDDHFKFLHQSELPADKDFATMAMRLGRLLHLEQTGKNLYTAEEKNAHA